MLCSHPDTPFSKRDLAKYLETGQGRASRYSLAVISLVNLLLVQLRKERPESIRAIDSSPGADQQMNNALFIDICPGLNRTMLDYVIETIRNFCKIKQ